MWIYQYLIYFFLQRLQKIFLQFFMNSLNVFFRSICSPPPWASFIQARSFGSVFNNISLKSHHCGKQSFRKTFRKRIIDLLETVSAKMLFNNECSLFFCELHTEFLGLWKPWIWSLLISFLIQFRFLKNDSKHLTLQFTKSTIGRKHLN